MERERDGEGSSRMGWGVLARLHRSALPLPHYRHPSISSSFRFPFCGCFSYFNVVNLPVNAPVTDRFERNPFFGRKIF